MKQETIPSNKHKYNHENSYYNAPQNQVILFNKSVLNAKPEDIIEVMTLEESKRKKWI